MSPADSDRRLSFIPSVQLLLEKLVDLYPDFREEILKSLIRSQLEILRQKPDQYSFLSGLNKETNMARIINLLESEIETLRRGTLGKAINATGVVLHTGLGRAPINPDWIAGLQNISRYATLEIRTEDGKRGERNDHLRTFLRLLTGAEDGFAVNNNAAAVMLMLNSVAAGKEVIISRGELIEIGGSFRLPEVMKASGVYLKEIGATNKTHLKDYASAIQPNTGAILICHPSNYEVVGFTQKPEIADIVQLAHQHNLPVLYDLGSGSLFPSATYSDGNEPDLQTLVEAGVDLISFSGDKLLGGPQAGIIIGKSGYIQKCEKNHLLRALRLDKFMLFLLQTLLQKYLYKTFAEIFSDTHQALLVSPSVLRERSEKFMLKLPDAIQKQITIIETEARVGSGAYPVLPLPSIALRLHHPQKSAEKLASELRLNLLPVFSVIAGDAVQLDLRTVSTEEEKELLGCLENVLSRPL